MDETEVQNTDPRPRHSFKLTPHRSLGPNGFVLLMALVSFISFVAGVIFWLAGAWPVVGFFGLDVLLIYGAFKLNYAAARIYETVDITDRELLVRSIGLSFRELGVARI